MDWYYVDSYEGAGFLPLFKAKLQLHFLIPDGPVKRYYTNVQWAGNPRLDFHILITPTSLQTFFNFSKWKDLWPIPRRQFCNPGDYLESSRPVWLEKLISGDKVIEVAGNHCRPFDTCEMRCINVS